MNELFTISFEGITNNADEVLQIESIAVNTLLSPMYCTEYDIMQEFLEPTSTAYIDQVRELVFNGSIEVDNFISMYGLNQKLTAQQLALIKRDYVTCYGIARLGSVIYLDYLSSTNKDKFMGDVKISLGISKNPVFIKDKLDSASECISAIKAMFQTWNDSTAMMATFVKGECNTSSRVAEREWWHDYPIRSVPVAGTKQYNSNAKSNQKIGAVNTVYYDQYK